MKLIKITLVISTFLCIPFTFCGQELIQGGRKTLWLNGPGNTSHYWSRTKTFAKSPTHGAYKFTEINTHHYEGREKDNSIYGWADNFNNILSTGNHENVLGIGHDAGGLILRRMSQIDNDQLSALILDGVPNNGGKIFEVLLPSSAGGNKSIAQRKMEEFMDIRTQAQSCSGCRMLEATKRWFDGFLDDQKTREYYNQLKPNSPLFYNLPPPDIPYAIIWGNEEVDDGLSLSRLIGSYHNGIDGEDYNYISCYKRELGQRKSDIKDQQLLSTLRAISTLAGSFAKVKIGEPLTYTAALEGAINAIVIQMQANNNVTKEIREIAECELVHQGLNIWWHIAVSTYSYRRETVSFPPIYCEYCSLCGNLPQPEQNLCIQECQNHPCNPDDFTHTYYAFEIEPHDALLARSEQLLTGASKTYEAKGCNHFQEQFWDYAPIRNAFNDLFQGFAGTAFVVPK